MWGGRSIVPQELFNLNENRVCRALLYLLLWQKFLKVYQLYIISALSVIDIPFWYIFNIRLKICKKKFRWMPQAFFSILQIQEQIQRSLSSTTTLGTRKKYCQGALVAQSSVVKIFIMSENRWCLSIKWVEWYIVHGFIS